MTPQIEGRLDKGTGEVSFHMPAWVASRLLAVFGTVPSDGHPEEAAAGRAFYEALCATVDAGNAWRKAHEPSYPEAPTTPILATPGEVEVITDAIATRRYPWCRARLLHALAGAYEQGILAEVMTELFDETSLAWVIGQRLRATRWISAEVNPEPTKGKPETTLQIQVRLVLEGQARKVADAIADSLHPGTGFALFVFDFGDGGNLAYVSNAQRPDMVRAIHEWLRRTR